MLKKTIKLFAAAAIVLASQASYADINVGVNAPRGKLKALKQWDAFSSYLSAELGEKVTITPLTPGELVSSAGSVDFVLSNPTHAVILIEEEKAKEVATLNKKSGAQFAGVIVAKKGKGISKAEDLKGKKVMSLKFRQAAGAYMFQTYHLIQKGIDPHKDFASFKEGKKQDDLVLAVNAGIIDAAFIRTGTLEAMSKEGRIKMENFVIVDERKDPGFGLVHTTVLYPEWYMLAMPNAAGKADKMKAAALKLGADSQAAKKAKIKGFVEPVSIEPMRAAMKELKVRPFN